MYGYQLKDIKWFEYVCVRVFEHVSLSTPVLMYYYMSIAMCVMLHAMYMMMHVYSGNDGIACALSYT